MLPSPRLRKSYGGFFPRQDLYNAIPFFPNGFFK
uniref:Uncharacterized protein n=1 Tax=Rubinisphaera brasiliensis (strain ATCC 49424 / DSM 5305 / JCM 21570 / IAM 15109 / NBRC 103401 / IFAM 1448) TaxID=756272 RepID=F0SHJ8_RUBBR|nr:hypothetical protein Plabr_0813 [Rubinisphaera brasiliensis DSM 5305]